jgi:hypothetical protein
MCSHRCICDERDALLFVQSFLEEIVSAESVRVIDASPLTVVLAKRTIGPEVKVPKGPIPGGLGSRPQVERRGAGGEALRRQHVFIGQAMDACDEARRFRRLFPIR